MSIRIGQASLGETGGRGQKPGNQTGRELNFSYWYNGSWLGILRFKDPAMSERAAQACEDGVRNRNIGYDMDGRNTAYAAAEAVDFALGKINKPVETDCSAFMMLCAISAGATELKKLFRRPGQQLHDLLYAARLADDRTVRDAEREEVFDGRPLAAARRHPGIPGTHGNGIRRRRNGGREHGQG